MSYLDGEGLDRLDRRDAERAARPTILPDPIECTACGGEGGENLFERCATCEGAGVLLPCARCGGAHAVPTTTAEPEPIPSAEPEPVYCAACGTYTCESANRPGAMPEKYTVERVDPRDFLDPTARAVAYLDLDDVDGARAALAQVSLARLRRLGEHYDRLSMICFELASTAHHAADNTVDPAAFRRGPDDEGIADHPAPGRPAAPVIDFEVDDLDDLGSADTTERNLP